MLLADNLQRWIVSGRIQHGNSVGAERDLMVQFGVSRQTVRESLRILQARGLLEVRKGRLGGSYVRRPNTDSIVHSLDLLIKGQSIRYRDIVAFREAIEPVAAGQAALYRTDADLEAIEQLGVACETSYRDIKKFVRYNFDWHLAIVKASQNPLFQMFMASISTAIQSATDLSGFNLKTRRIVVETHERIFDAIKEQDAAAAMRRMGRHINAYTASVAEMNIEALSSSE